jgi:hypothetical protein
MTTLQEKLARLDAATGLIESHVAAGGDLKSVLAAPVELELVHAFVDLVQEFGPKPLKSPFLE